MATYGYKPISVVSCAKGSGLGEKASQTGKQYNFAKPDTANTNYYMFAAAGDNTNLFIAGMNGENLSTATGDKKGVIFLDNDDVLEMTISGTPTAAQLKTGTAYGYGVDGTSGYGFVDLANTTTTAVSIVSLVPGYVVGDTRPRVYVKMLAAARF